MVKLQIGDRVTPNKACVAEYGNYFTEGKVYVVSSHLIGTKVYDDDGVCYLSSPDRFFKKLTPIYLGGE